jgi:hypothetical protein
VSSPADFVARFADYWASPSEAGLLDLLTEDVRLVQPMSRPAVGIAAATRWIAGVLRTIPDLRGEVDRWSASADGTLLFIEFRLSGTIGGKRTEWPVVDRFLLGPDDRASERVSYFDPLPLVLAGLRSPAGWRQLLRLAR